MESRLFLIVLSLIVLLSGGAAAQTDSILLDRRNFYRQGIVGLYDPQGNFNPGLYKWSELTPSQNHLPGLPRYVDPNRIQPFQERPVQSEPRNLSALIYRNCFESDRCEFSYPEMESSATKKLIIRLGGIQAPHFTASCEQESILGNQAKNLIHGYLSSAVHIELRNFSKYGREIEGRVVADGQDLSELLVKQGLAVPLDGNKKDWCS